jgi:serine/threonine protein kinase
LDYFVSSLFQNLVSLRDIFESSSEICLVFDYMRGGELLDKIVRQKFFSEREAREGRKWRNSGRF